MKTSHFLPNYDYSGRPFVPGGISATSNPQPNDHQQHHLQRQPSSSTQFQQSSLSGLIDHNNTSCDNNDVTITSTYSNQLSNSHNNFSSSSLTTVIKLPVSPAPLSPSSTNTAAIYGNSAVDQHHNSSTKYDTLNNTSSTQSEQTGNEYNVIRSTAVNSKYQQQYNHKAPPATSTTGASSSSASTTKRKRESGEFQKKREKYVK